MQSIRVRLAVYFSLALTATIIAFGAAVYLEWATTAPRRAELALDNQLDDDARVAVGILRSSRFATVSLGSRSDDSSRPGIEDIHPYFDPMAQYVFIANNVGQVIYTSPSAKALDEATLGAIVALMRRRPPPPGAGELPVAGDQPIRYRLEPVDSVRDVGAVIVAAPLQVDLAGVQQIFRSMLPLAPLIIVASGWLGYWLAGRSLLPIEGMINELDAVQDGTSLHRRLAVSPGDDEVSRLGQRLNDMLGRVEQSFVVLRRFTADASHELKTPLMVLRAGVERSLTHPRTPGEIVPALDETLRQINQMSELVTNLLTLARVDEGRASLTLVDTDLRTLVSEAAETAEMLSEIHSLTTRVELPPYAVMLAVDPGRIRQLLMNLVTNAVKYTTTGGRVTIRLVDRPEAVTLSVQDTGIGIAPGDLPNVFERFWRADLARSRTGEHPGTGLGLAIAKWIVDAHGGTIAAQSRPGRGSTFTVTLPKGQASSARGTG